MQLINSFKSLSLTKVNIFLIILLPVSLLTGSLILNLNIFLIVFFFLIDCKKRNIFLLFKEKSFIFLLIIWLYLIFNSIYVGDTSDSIIRAMGFIRFIFLTYAIFFYLNLNNKIYENLIFKYWIYLFLIVSVDLIFESIFDKNILGNQPNYPGRLASFTGDELKIGGYYFGFISLALSYIYNRNKKFFFITFILFFTLSLLIGERANFIKIFIIYIMFLIFIFEISNLKKIIALISLCIIASVIISNANGFKSKFYNHVFNVYNDEPITIKLLNPENLVKNLHFSHYYTAINIFKHNPIFGVGMKEFRIESKKKNIAQSVEPMD